MASCALEMVPDDQGQQVTDDRRLWIGSRTASYNFQVRAVADAGHLTDYRSGSPASE